MTMPSWLVFVLWVQTTSESMLAKLASVARASLATVLQRSTRNNFLSRRTCVGINDAFAKSMSCVAAEHHHFNETAMRLPKAIVGAVLSSVELRDSYVFAVTHPLLLTASQEVTRGAHAFTHF